MTIQTAERPLEALGLQPLDDGAPRWSGQPWHARLLDTLSSYLSLLMMALLALGSWWLVTNTPLVEAPRVKAPLTHEPDYTMREFLVQRFTPQGTLRAQIEGDTLRHYPDTDTFEVDNPKVRAWAADGGVTDASAKRALSNADASEVQLFGDARVTRLPTATDEGLTFRGEFLHAFLKTERVRSDQPVTFTRGAAVIRADSFTYDNIERIVEMKGHVRASFPPRRTTVRGDKS
ncbi:MAG: LPS export ABC transporter periplasmic protein LptC [Burkholderiales bacterium]|nr:LPS export ABC transporter periplasmic protein LptC [Burkholderiales bacterium]